MITLELTEEELDALQELFEMLDQRDDLSCLPDAFSDDNMHCKFKQACISLYTKIKQV